LAGLGNHFFAVGGNRDSAVSVGINAGRAKMAAFVISSLFATAAGILSVTRVNSGTTETQSFMELEAVAVCVMGGIALTGGRGSVIGICLGACMLRLVQDVIIMAQLPGFYLDLFIGIVIVFGVTLNQVAKKKY
jgi:simple sugar transport system permease protein